MGAVALGMLILGYALVYSGISQMSGHDEWGFVASLTGKTPSSGVGKNVGSLAERLFQEVKPQGNSGQTPSVAQSPISGVTPA